jgi:hypothetical protein
MKDRWEIELEGVDLLLSAAIVVLSILVVVMLLPDLWGLLIAVWKGFRIVVNVRNWPFWVWTCIGVAVLCVLVWLRSRYEW